MPTKDQLGQCRIRGCRTPWRSPKSRLCYKHRAYDEVRAARGNRCTVPDCDSPVLSKGLCSTHQYDLYKELEEPTLVLVESLFAALISPDEDGCWLWTGNTRDGYSTVKINGRWTSGHRWLYMHLVGPIRDAHELHHECEKPRCVRPGHLRPVMPNDHRRITAFSNWMFRIVPTGKLAIDNVSRSERECRFAAAYGLPYEQALQVGGGEPADEKLPIPPER